MKLKKRMFKLHFRAEKESLQMDHLKRLTDHAIEVFLFVVIQNSGYNNVDDIYERMTSLSCHQHSPSPKSVTNIVIDSYFNFSFKTE